MTDIFLGLGANGERQTLRLGRANRHGLIAGATGTGKTVTLQTIAEQFSAEGVPVFLADVKGDLAGVAMPGSHEFKHADKLESRAAEIGITDYAYHDNPAVFWDGCWGSTRRRRGCSTSLSAMPMTMSCC